MTINTVIKYLSCNACFAFTVSELVLNQATCGNTYQWSHIMGVFYWYLHSYGLTFVMELKCLKVLYIFLLNLMVCPYISVFS